MTFDDLIYKDKYDRQGNLEEDPGHVNGVVQFLTPGDENYGYVDILSFLTDDDKWELGITNGNWPLDENGAGINYTFIIHGPGFYVKVLKADGTFRNPTFNFCQDGCENGEFNVSISQQMHSIAIFSIKATLAPGERLVFQYLSTGKNTQVTIIRENKIPLLEKSKDIFYTQPVYEKTGQQTYFWRGQYQPTLRSGFKWTSGVDTTPGRADGQQEINTNAVLKFLISNSHPLKYEDDEYGTDSKQIKSRINVKTGKTAFFRRGSRWLNDPASSQTLFDGFNATIDLPGKYITFISRQARQSFLLGYKHGKTLSKTDAEWEATNWSRPQYYTGDANYNDTLSGTKPAVPHYGGTTQEMFLADIKSDTDFLFPQSTKYADITYIDSLIPDSRNEYFWYMPRYYFAMHFRDFDYNQQIEWQNARSIYTWQYLRQACILRISGSKKTPDKSNTKEQIYTLKARQRPLKERLMEVAFWKTDLNVTKDIPEFRITTIDGIHKNFLVAGSGTRTQGLNIGTISLGIRRGPKWTYRLSDSYNYGIRYSLTPWTPPAVYTSQSLQDIYNKDPNFHFQRVAAIYTDIFTSKKHSNAQLSSTNLKGSLIQLQTPYGLPTAWTPSTNPDDGYSGWQMTIEVNRNNFTMLTSFSPFVWINHTDYVYTNSVQDGLNSYADQITVNVLEPMVGNKINFPFGINTGADDYFRAIYGFAMKPGELK